jgi:5-formyltetrahydrofolate cyclo-ligase
MTKDELRAQALLKRKNMGAQEIEEKSQQTISLLEKFLNKKPPFDDFLCYSPLKGELDLTAFYQKLLNRSKNLYFPTLNLEQNTMDFYKITALTQLCFTNIYEIKEPLKTPLLRFRSNATYKKVLILIPALLFDLHGTRLGFGKGFLIDFSHFTIYLR